MYGKCVYVDNEHFKPGISKTKTKKPSTPLWLRYRSEWLYVKVEMSVRKQVIPDIPDHEEISHFIFDKIVIED